jgi:cholesterol transport system auxiliary component
MDQEKQMRNKILIFLIFILFSGCNLKQESIAINHYSIDFKTKKVVDKPKYNSIFIEESQVNRAFNLTSIFYSQKDYKFEEYAKNRWINFPSNMVYNQIIDSFNSSNLFSSVITKDKKLTYEYLLKSEIIKLYQVFEQDKSYAIIKVNFDLIKDKKVIKSYSFDKKILCKTNDAYGFVKATNKGLEEVINTLLKQLAD